MYVLERHIGKYQALAPGTKKSGLHRGEAFYHRTALSELHTAERWQREGREVLPEARDAPAKINRRRGFKLPPGATDPAAKVSSCPNQLLLASTERTCCTCQMSCPKYHGIMPQAAICMASSALIDMDLPFSGHPP